MTSKEALERVKTAPGFIAIPSVYTAYTQSSSAFLEDIEIIEKDLDLLEDMKSVFKDCCIANKITDSGINRELSIGEKFDRELFKDLLNQLGFEIKEK